MASSFPSSSGIKRYHVFPSFLGLDVRRGFLSHLHNHFASKGITTFNDQDIERGQTIGPELVQAIRESRLSIVVLSKKYASSSWCLDELVEILKCKANEGLIVLTVFFNVDPSDVRNQSGDFGSAFETTCQRESEEVKLRWRNALTDVATIEGEHARKWPNEAEMIQKIATDISKKLNLTTPARNYEGMVGLEPHLTKLESLLWQGGCDDAKMIGIWGRAGIGKTTIAGALYNKLSSSFQLKCFMRNHKGTFKSIVGVDDYESNKSLQQQLLSKVLNQGDMKTAHLDAIRGRVQDQRVLIILEDVDDLEQLEVLATKLSWFGSASRIIITTEDKKILKAHGIHGIYHVDYPSEKDALEILCRSAFKQSSVPYGFEELANKVAAFCGKLPLGLCVVGSSLHGESKHEWELQLSRIKTTSFDGKIENVLKVGYSRLSKEEQSLFLHIACFFNNEVVDHVKYVLSDTNLDVGNGLKILTDKSLVHISDDGRLVMHHYLLQKLGREIVRQQSCKAGKRQFLTDPEEIRDALTKETDTGSVIGISLDPTSKSGEVSVKKVAFEGMHNLQFLRIYGGALQIPKDMKYLPLNLRLLHWEIYPRKCLATKFQPERLVEIHMPSSNLKDLWEGTKPLPNLKSIDLSNSHNLEKFPDLSKATNLETLKLVKCTSLVKLHSSIKNLHKLSKLNMSGCSNLRDIPTKINLASLEEVDMSDCSRLGSFPDISSNMKILRVGNTKIEDVPPSVAGWSRLECLEIGSRSLKRLTHVPLSITSLDLSNSDIKKIPDCITSLPHLVDLIVENCTKLVSIPALSSSLESLNANECVSLKRLYCTLHNPIKVLTFYNCLKLDKEARKRILQQRVVSYICLPGKEVPVEFTHKATGNSITIPHLASSELGTSSASSRFKVCLLLSPIKDYRDLTIACHLRSEGGLQLNSINNFARLPTDMSPPSQSKHLFIFEVEVDVTMNEILFEFSCWYSDDKIIECGVQLLTEEAESSRNNQDRSILSRIFHGIFNLS